jgi:hypothetical protein
MIHCLDVAQVVVVAVSGLEWQSAQSGGAVQQRPEQDSQQAMSWSVYVCVDD